MKLIQMAILLGILPLLIGRLEAPKGRIVVR
jgi:hypothetical protein